MRDIQRQLDHDLTLREFLSVKGQKRILRDLEEKERIKREMEAQDLENLLQMYEKTMEKIQVSKQTILLYTEVLKKKSIHFGDRFLASKRKNNHEYRPQKVSLLRYRDLKVKL